MAAGRVVRLVLAAVPFEVIVGAIAEGLARFGRCRSRALATPVDLDL
jgi:hypothetical protein